MKTHSTSKTIALSLGVLVMSTFLGLAALAWADPSSPPPLGNVANLIKMSLGFAQINDSSNPSIWIKNIGGGDLIRLETEEGAKFAVENTGNINMSENVISNLGLPLEINDAVSKEFVTNYVDAASAENCEVKHGCVSWMNQTTLTCSTGYTISEATCNGTDYCYMTSPTTMFLRGRTSSVAIGACGSILCCD